MPILALAAFKPARSMAAMSRSWALRQSHIFTGSPWIGPVHSFAICHKVQVMWSKQNIWHFQSESQRHHVQSNVHVKMFCFVWFSGPKVKCCIGQLWVLKQITIHDHTLNVKRVHGVCCQACNMLISKQLATCGTLSKITFFLLKHIWQLIAIAKCKIHTISPWTTEPVIRGTLSKIIPWWRLEGTSRLSRTQSQLQQHAQFPEQFAPQSVSSCLVLWSKDEMQNWPGVGFKANRTPWSRLECKARPRCLASDLQHVDFQTSSCVVH